MHAVATRESVPVVIAIGPRDQHEGKGLISLMESIRIEQPEGRIGRPRKRPKRVYADTKYGMHINRFYLDAKRLSSQIPTTVKKGLGEDQESSIKRTTRRLDR